MRKSGKIFNELAERTLEPEQKSNVYYNQGNNLIESSKNTGKRLKHTKEVLRLNPNDYDAKYNLEYARKKLSDQQQQQTKPGSESGSG